MCGDFSGALDTGNHVTQSHDQIFAHRSNEQEQVSSDQTHGRTTICAESTTDAVTYGQSCKNQVRF